MTSAQHSPTRQARRSSGAALASERPGQDVVHGAVEDAGLMPSDVSSGTAGGPKPSEPSVSAVFRPVDRCPAGALSLAATGGRSLGSSAALVQAIA